MNAYTINFSAVVNVEFSLFFDLPLDVDECLDGTNNCNVNANCTDTIGSFECTCVAGYAGDGVRNCTGIYSLQLSRIEMDSCELSLSLPSSLRCG